MAIISQTVIKNEQGNSIITSLEDYNIIKFGIIVDKELLTRKAENNLCFIVRDSDGAQEFFMNDKGIFEVDEVSVDSVEIKNITKDMEIIIDYIMEEK